MKVFCARTQSTQKVVVFFFRAERESGGVFVLKRKESFPRALLRVCMCDMPGQKRDIMKRKMSVFVCLSFSL